jgi:uncharacterized protein (DUF983 family)
VSAAATRLLYSRALRLRCPACGSGPVFLTWFRMCPSCPACGLHFDREPEGGYWVGSYTINLMATEAILAGVFVAGAFLTWPTPPWEGLAYGDMAVAMMFPAFFFPFSKTLFIAVDLTFRPNEPKDYEEPREVTPHSSRGRRS